MWHVLFVIMVGPHLVGVTHRTETTQNRASGIQHTLAFDTCARARVYVRVWAFRDSNEAPRSHSPLPPPHVIRASTPRSSSATETNANDHIARKSGLWLGGGLRCMGRSREPKPHPYTDHPLPHPSPPPLLPRLGDLGAPRRTLPLCSSV